jgi:hypothetical protein
MTCSTHFAREKKVNPNPDTGTMPNDPLPPQAPMQPANP